MTQSSIQAYESKVRVKQNQQMHKTLLIMVMRLTNKLPKKTKVEEKYNSLKQAIAGLTPDLAPLQTAKTQLQNDIDQPTSTTGMTSASVATFNENFQQLELKFKKLTVY